MTLRFKQGDMAILLMLPTRREGSKTGPGDIVEIARVGPFAAGDRIDMSYGIIRLGREYDYILHCGNEVGGAMDSWLAPIGQPAEDIDQEATLESDT
jgi:hypothetical protein